MFRLAAGGVGGAANKNDRKFLGFAPRELVERGRGARGWHWHALRAYDWVSNYHALGAWKGQSLRDWKKVRAFSNKGHHTVQNQFNILIRKNLYIT